MGLGWRVGVNGAGGAVVRKPGLAGGHGWVRHWTGEGGRSREWVGNWGQEVREGITLKVRSFPTQACGMGAGCGRALRQG